MTNDDTFARRKRDKDFALMIADTEALLRAMAGGAEDEVKAARSGVERVLASAKAHAEELESVAADDVRAAIKATDLYVHETPWVAIGIAASVGLIAGWALSQK